MPKDLYAQSGVDINKGNSSIKAMALGQAGFQTLIDAFLASKDEKDVNKLA